VLFYIITGVRHSHKEVKMATYITLVKFSAETLKNMGNFGSVYEEGVKMGQKMGIRSIGAYATMGPYDAMFIYEAPDEKTAVGMVMSLATKQGGTTETWTAIPMEEFAKLAAGMK
jgi:uncharacterized protein with GYD domain